VSGVPFGVILLANYLEKLYGKDRFLVWGILLTVILGFIFFYPLLTSLQIPNWYLRFLTGTGKFS
jgi:hypothetical protein